MNNSCKTNCDGHNPSTSENDSSTSEAFGKWFSVFGVPKMDCPSEEQIIRMALSDFEDIQALSFDLSNRRLEIVHDGDIEPITQKLTTLGFGASLQETVATDPEIINAVEGRADSTTQESRTLRWLLGINAVLFIVEMTTGLIAQSTGLIGESLDNFADAAVANPHCVDGVCNDDDDFDWDSVPMHQR